MGGFERSPGNSVARAKDDPQPRRVLSASDYNGVLVAVEGIDGAGKTTQVTLVSARLRELGLDVVTSKEPTAGKHGQRLRDSAWTGRLSPEEELETFIADRQDHVSSLVLPALHAGKIVILDRYYFSTAAYQGSRGHDWNQIIARNESFAPQPDLLVLLEIDPAAGIGRVSQRDGRTNHFERVADLEQVQSVFREIQKPYLQRLDGSRAQSDIRDAIVLGIVRIAAGKMAARQDMDIAAKERITTEWFARLDGLAASRPE